MASAVPSLAPVMPEAEVSLRVALWLLDCHPALQRVDVAIDGAHVRIAAHESAGRTVAERTVFDVRGFLEARGWTPPVDGWRGTYTTDSRALVVDSRTGFDVQADLPDGSHWCIESKGGPLSFKKGRSAGQIFAVALGQTLLTKTLESSKVFVALPSAKPYLDAAIRAFESAPFRRTGVGVLLVGEAGVQRLRA